MTASQYKTVRPRKRVPPKKRAPKRTAPKPRVITHRSLGPCTLVGVFLTDAGSIVVDCDVAGVKRALSLDHRYWLSDISTLTLEAVKRKPMKPEKAEPSVAADEETETDEPELVPGEDGHLRSDQAETETDEDADVELVSESA
jgi:hypothetical protein